MRVGSSFSFHFFHVFEIFQRVNCRNCLLINPFDCMLFGLLHSWRKNKDIWSDLTGRCFCISLHYYDWRSGIRVAISIRSKLATDTSISLPTIFTSCWYNCDQKNETSTRNNLFDLFKHFSRSNFGDGYATNIGEFLIFTRVFIDDMAPSYVKLSFDCTFHHHEVYSP
jgi:hypothetical protein